MNPKAKHATPMSRPRTVALAGVMALAIALIWMAVAEKPAEATPPPPLRGPFQFIQLPEDWAAAAASGLSFPTPFYTQTFDSSLAFSPGWQLTVTTSITDTPNLHRWEYVARSSYPGQAFTSTLWAASWLPGRPENYTVIGSSAYLPWMNTWAIYGPLNSSQYSQFRAEFDFYLDADPGASFGWASSGDGRVFCGQMLSSHINKWVHASFDLTPCPNQTGRPVYLAFVFQSNGDTPAGLGAFVDNLTISGVPWIKSYMPIIRRDATPTASATPLASPTPPFTGVRNYDFESNNPTTSSWCVRNSNYSGPDWGSGIKLLGGSNSYFLGLKNTQWWVMMSPRYTTPDNYRIKALFSLLGMDGNVPLSNYGGALFGFIFGVEGEAFPGTDSCAWQQGSGSFYRIVIRINLDASKFRTRAELWTDGRLAAESGYSDVPATISRTGWNTLQLDRGGGDIVWWINGVQAGRTFNSDFMGGRFFGIFTETEDKIGSLPFEVNWDDIQIYNIGN